MNNKALVQTRIDPEIRDRAAAVLDAMGLSVSDAVRILLTRTANEGALPLELVGTDQAYDTWFRKSVLAAINDPRPPINHDLVEAEFAARRAELRSRIS